MLQSGGDFVGAEPRAGGERLFQGNYLALPPSQTDQILVAVDELVARYGTQVDRYREAGECTSGEPVAVAELLHIRSVQAVGVPRGEP